VTAALLIAGKEFRDGLRNRWTVATTLLLAALALSLAFLGSAPGGTVAASPLAVTVVSLSSLTIFLVPLIALLLSHDAVVGEIERGTMALLLAYPVPRAAVIAGKFLGHVAILGVATALGYGAAGVAVTLGAGAFDLAAAGAFAGMIGSSILLGAVFLALGYLVSALARERARAAGIAIGLWLGFVLVYDLALLGLLVADEGRILGSAGLAALLLLNPADIYRLLNLSGFGEASLFSGMAGLADDARLPPALLAAALLGWVAAPLAAAILVFRRRQV
jgi:Cu-processing system permease protein